MCNIHNIAFRYGLAETIIGFCDIRYEGFTDFGGIRHACQKVIVPSKEEYHECGTCIPTWLKSNAGQPNLWDISDLTSLVSGYELEESQRGDEVMKIIVRNEAYLKRRPTCSSLSLTTVVSFEYPGETAIKHQHCVNDEFLARRYKRKQFQLHRLGQQQEYQIYVDASQAHKLAVSKLEESTLVQEVLHLRTSGDTTDGCPTEGSGHEENFCQPASREIGRYEQQRDGVYRFHTASRKPDDQLETQSVTTETSETSTTSQGKAEDTTDGSSLSPETAVSELDDSEAESPDKQEAWNISRRCIRPRLIPENERIQEELKQQRCLLPLDSEGGKAVLAEIKEYLSLSVESTPAEVFALQNRIPSLFKSIKEGKVPLRPRSRVPTRKKYWKRDIGLRRPARVSDERWTINSEFVRAWDALRWTDLEDTYPPLLVQRHKRAVIRKKDIASTREVQVEIKPESPVSGISQANPHQPKVPSRLRITTTCEEPRPVSEVSTVSLDKELIVGRPFPLYNKICVNVLTPQRVF
jgi:hypothetical protein